MNKKFTLFILYILCFMSVFWKAEATIVVADTTYYLLRVDTFPLMDNGKVSSSELYLSIDTTRAEADTLTVAEKRGILSLWMVTDTVVRNDTTYIKLLNRFTGKPLAFDVPRQDTVAQVNPEGALNLFRVSYLKMESQPQLGADGAPLYDENQKPLFENVVRRNEEPFLVLRDTLDGRDYFLGLDETVVMILGNNAAATSASQVKPLFFNGIDTVVPFIPSERPLPPVLSDSSEVYTVKFLTGNNVGKYLFMDGNRADVYLDTVYAHLPEGQFVVDTTTAEYHLVSRISEKEEAKVRLQPVAMDTIVSAVRHDTLFLYHPNQFYCRGEAVEVKPITYGDTAAMKHNPYLGFAQLDPAETQVSYYMFAGVGAETVKDRLLGLDGENVFALLQPGDTAGFIIEHAGDEPYGPLSVGGIGRLMRTYYRLRPMQDTNAYAHVRKADSLLVLDEKDLASRIYLHEDTVVGQYSLMLCQHHYVEWDRDLMFKVDTLDGRLKGFGYMFNEVPEGDTAAVFKLIPHRRLLDHDIYEYESQLLGNRQGAFFNIKDEGGRFLTKTMAGALTFAKEGEAKLRSGSYASHDLKMWIGKALEPEILHPDKQSYFIANDLQEDETGLYVAPTGHVLRISKETIEIDGVKRFKAEYGQATMMSGEQVITEEEGITSAEGYRFFLQRLDKGGFLIVTEDGLAGEDISRGYLSHKTVGTREEFYFGAREEATLFVIEHAVDVANEVIPKPVVVKDEKDEKEKALSIVGGTGKITVLGGEGRQMTVFNIVGQQVVNRMLTAENEEVAVPRGIAIVKIGEAKTQKVIVK